MRIEQAESMWVVYATPGEFYGNASDLLLGFISPRGAIRVSSFRGERRRTAQTFLGDARRDLVSRGHIRDRALERAIEEEARTGSFIVELDNGEERRFHSFAPEPGRRTTAPRYNRPSASEWAEESLRSGRATHADLFRGPVAGDRTRDKIFVPHILAGSDKHPPLFVGEVEQLPVHSWSMRDGSGFLRGVRPHEVQRAYEVKKHVMDLVIDHRLRVVGPRREDEPVVPRSQDIADAWEVAVDAFEEAGLPLQARFARRNVEYWRDGDRLERKARRS